MKTSKRLSVMFSLALFFAVMVSSVARADEWDRATKLTFSGPVEIPGQVLPAGTYWFTLADSTSNRNIVQIWNSDRTELIRTILAIPNYRMHPKDETVIKFSERPHDAPEAIHTWFYPGTTYGIEFVYPKARATQLAKQVNEPVLEMPDERVSDAAPQIKQAPVKAMAPTGEEVEVAEVVTQETVIEQPLPQTGSPLPLIGLIGLLSIGGAVSLRKLAQTTN